MAFGPWFLGLGAVALACLWPQSSTLLVFFLPGLWVVRVHELAEKVRSLYWPLVIVAALLLSEVGPGGGAMASLELILMAWALSYSHKRSWDIPRALIFVGVVFTVALGLVAGLSIYYKAVDASTVLSSIEKGIDQGLSVYDIDAGQRQEIKEAMVRLVPSMIVITVTFFAYLNCAVADWVARRHGRGPFFGPKIQGFRLPEPFIWVGIVGGAGTLFAHGALHVFSTNLLLVALTLYCVQGAGMLRYFMLQYKLHGLIQAVVFLLLMSSWYGLLGLTVMGVSDVWTNVRHIPLDGDASEVRY